MEFDFTIHRLFISIYELHFVIQAALLAYIVGLPGKGPVKRNLTWVVGIYVLYAGCSVFMSRAIWLPGLPLGVQAEFEDFPDLYGVAYPIWIATVMTSVTVFLVACLHFWYALLGRKRDWQMWFFYATSLVGVCLYIFFPENLKTNQDTGKMLALFYLPGQFYGLWLLWRGLRTLPEGMERRRLRIIFWAFLLPILAVFVLKGLASNDKISAETDLIATVAVGLLRSILLVIAIKVYGLFRLDLAHASHDIFENMDDPVVLLSPDGEVIRANPSAQNCLGVMEIGEGAKSGLAIDKILPEYRSQETEFEVALPTDVGDRTYVCTRSDVLHNGVCLGNVLMFRDVTRERELAQMKTEFTSTVSHELRTPLTSVLGFAKIIQKRFQEVILANYEPKEKKELRAVKQITQNLDVIVSESKRLTKLINDVLDISKMEAGKVEWNLQRSDPRALVERAIQATDGLFGTKPIELIRQIPDEVPPIVADSDRLIQVVINLISNAVKFTDAGSVTVALEVEPNNLVVRVVDTGSGIGEADQGRVFEKYRQVGDVITDKPQGTGLGLPISKEIVEHHGGRIWVESVLGEGSTFAFSVPFAEVPQTLQEPISFTDLVQQIERMRWSPATGAQKILVVDDEAPIRQVLRQSLENAGHQVFEAEDGLEGLRLAREHRPNLIILDVMMPRLNGFDVAASLKNDPEFMSIPILMLTVLDDAQRAYGMGVDRYISKPFEPQQIVHEVKSLITERAGDTHAIILGNPGDRQARLEQAMGAGDLVPHTVPELGALADALDAHPPTLIVVMDEELHGAETRHQIRTILGSRSALVRYVTDGGG